MTSLLPPSAVYFAATQYVPAPLAPTVISPVPAPPTNIVPSWLASVELSRISRHPDPNYPLTEPELQRMEQAWAAFHQSGVQRGCRWTVVTTSSIKSHEAQGLLKPMCPDVVYIDYVNMFADAQQDPEKLWFWLGKIAYIYKSFAIANNCVVVLLAQLDEKTRAIRYSRMIKEHADFLWTWTYGEEERETNIVEVEQDKARHGARYPFKLVSRFNYGCFEDYVPEVIAAPAVHPVAQPTPQQVAVYGSPYQQPAAGMPALA